MHIGISVLFLGLVVSASADPSTDPCTDPPQDPATTAPPTGPVTDPDRIAGRYRIADSRKRIEERLDTVLARAAAMVPLILRPLVRTLMAPNIQPCDHYRFTHDGAFLVVDCQRGESGGGSDEDPVRVRLDGQTTTLVSDGDPYSVEGDWVEGTFRVSILGQKGGRITGYRFEPDGNLRVQPTITSRHLDEPLSWELAYRRIP